MLTKQDTNNYFIGQVLEVTPNGIIAKTALSGEVTVSFNPKVSAPQRNDKISIERLDESKFQIHANFGHYAKQ